MEHSKQPDSLRCKGPKELQFLARNLLSFISVACLQILIKEKSLTFGKQFKTSRRKSTATVRIQPNKAKSERRR